MRLFIGALWTFSRINRQLLYDWRAEGAGEYMIGALDIGQFRQIPAICRDALIALTLGAGGEIIRAR
jgi:hypothetical protein